MTLFDFSIIGLELAVGDSLYMVLPQPRHLVLIAPVNHRHMRYPKRPRRCADASEMLDYVCRFHSLSVVDGK